MKTRSVKRIPWLKYCPIFIAPSDHRTSSYKDRKTKNRLNPVKGDGEEKKEINLAKRRR